MTLSSFFLQFACIKFRTINELLIEICINLLIFEMILPDVSDSDDEFEETTLHT